MHPTTGRKAIIITGGSSGIGRATACLLSREGYQVVIVGHTPQRVTAAVSDAAANGTGTVEGMCLDVRSEEDMAAMAQATKRRFGRIDALIHAAGISRSANRERTLPQAVVQQTASDWRDVLATNLTGTFLANRAVLPSMLAQGHGTIVNISSSPAGVTGQPFAAAYSASKAAVAAFSEALAQEVGGRGVRVYALFPDLVDTPMTRHTTLQHRFGAPLSTQTVADLILYMLQLPPDTTLPTQRQLGYPVLRRLPQDVGEWTR